MALLVVGSPEYFKALCLCILAFARMAVWEFDMFVKYFLKSNLQRYGAELICLKLWGSRRLRIASDSIAKL
jgi:hypothetical protein